MRQLFQHHPTIGYHFIPGLKARGMHENGGYLVRVNGAGFRSNREFALAKQPGVKRALLFGDSFTAGNGVANDKRYGDVLEKLIPGLEVYNYGIPGTGTDQQYLAYRQFAQETEHDLLIIAVLVENIRRIRSRYRFFTDDTGTSRLYKKPFYELDGGQLLLRGVPVPSNPFEESELSDVERRTIDRGGPLPGIRKTIESFGIKDMCQRLMRYQPVPEYNNPADPAWLLLRAILERWIREHPKPVLLVPIPLHLFVEETSDPAAYQRRFREVRETTGCLYHDPLPDLLKYPLTQRKAFRFVKDTHLSPAGHVALAKSLESSVMNALSA